MHNLGDMMKSNRPYVRQFNEIIRSIFAEESTGAEKFDKFKGLLSDPTKRKLLHSAHPGLDHFVPLIVGLGAGAGLDSKGPLEAKELY